jgi:4-hydroxy-3-polyprenylbenzoate decarboxylase
MQDLPLVLALTGASGATYGRRLLEVLLHAGREVHLTISSAAAQVLQAELGLRFDLDQPDVFTLVDAQLDRLRYWHYHDLMAPMASGSFRTGGMVVAPCSTGTLGAIASGQGTNLIHRAAEVHLKEGRPLILVPRETPLSLIALENMTRAARAGAVILPATPGFYHRPTSVAELVDFVVGRICDRLGVEVELICRWHGGSQSAP